MWTGMGLSTLELEEVESTEGRCAWRAQITRTPYAAGAMLALPGQFPQPCPLANCKITQSVSSLDVDPGRHGSTVWLSPRSLQYGANCDPRGKRL